MHRRGIKIRAKEWIEPYYLLFLVERTDECLHYLVLHFDQVRGRWETPGLDVGNVFAEGRDTFVLQALMLGPKVTIGFRMTRQTFVIVTENIVQPSVRILFFEK